VDNPKNINGAGLGQAFRDFEDDLDREHGDILFEIRDAIHDAPGDPSAAVRAATRIFREHDWTIKRALRALRELV
jgi:hypothetical protein